MMDALLKWIFRSLLGASIILGGFIGWTYVTFDSRPPITSMDRTETLNSPIKVGEALTVRIWREKVRGDCPVLARRSAVNGDGRVFDIPDAATEGGPMDSPYIDVEYGTDHLVPGDYILMVDLTYVCPGFQQEISQRPTPFRVVDLLAVEPLVQGRKIQELKMQIETIQRQLDVGVSR